MSAIASSFPIATRPFDARLPWHVIAIAGSSPRNTEKRRLLERVRNPTDGRAIDVRTSPATAELAERLHAQFTRSLSPLTDALSRPDQRRLQVLLEAMLNRP